MAKELSKTGHKKQDCPRNCSEGWIYISDKTFNKWRRLREEHS